MPSSDQIDALNAAIASGALTVRYTDGRTVTYRSVAELQRARADLLRQMSGPVAPRRIRVAANKGIPGLDFGGRAGL
jgi:hypothetical protein